MKSGKRRGRKPLSDPRRVVLQFRVTESEAQAVYARAAAERLPVSIYLRRLVLGLEEEELEALRSLALEQGSANRDK